LLLQKATTEKLSQITTPFTGTVGSVATGLSPVAITIDPTSQFVYVANSGDNTVSAYSLALASPYLTPIGSAVAAGTTPSAVVAEIKKRYNAFFGTNLDQMLHRLMPDVLILAGINTHACVRVTAIDAYQRDWEIVVAADCVDSYDREHHDISMKYMKDKIATVMSNQQIRSALAAN
jgi:Isochorismatase family